MPQTLPFTLAKLWTRLVLPQSSGYRAELAG